MTYPIVEELSIEREYFLKGKGYAGYYFQYWNRDLGMYSRTNPRINSFALKAHWDKLHEAKTKGTVDDIELYYETSDGFGGMVFYPADPDYLKF